MQWSRRAAKIRAGAPLDYWITLSGNELLTTLTQAVFVDDFIGYKLHSSNCTD